MDGVVQIGQWKLAATGCKSCFPSLANLDYSLLRAWVSATNQVSSYAGKTATLEETWGEAFKLRQRHRARRQAQPGWPQTAGQAHGLHRKKSWPSPTLGHGSSSCRCRRMDASASSSLAATSPRPRSWPRSTSSAPGCRPICCRQQSRRASASPLVQTRGEDQARRSG